MSIEFFTNLPSHIIIDILSRLPIRTILRCKCVCKSWLDLLETNEFANSHLSKSVPGLIFLKKDYYESSKLYKIYDFEDGDHDLQHHELRYNLVTNFELPFRGEVQGSANGLLFFEDYSNGVAFVCNPITREYIEIHCPQEFQHAFPQVAVFGFGESRVSVQHKVVRVFYDRISDQESHNLVSNIKCHVYTLGIGTWRNVVVPRSGTGTLTCSRYSRVGFLNGNLHWLVFDSNGFPIGISCFDLETELFSILSLPPDPQRLCHVFILGDCLGVCDISSDDHEIDDEIVIWLMKEYGVEKSWTKEFVIKKPTVCGSCDPGLFVYPIKVFEDGDVLMAWCDFYLFYSSGKTRTSTVISMFEARRFGHIESILHTSTFLSLKSLVLEKLRSF